jgi:hypothetical protein
MLITALVKGKKHGFTRDGRVTVESTELRRAAESMGGCVGERTHGLSIAIKKLNGERVENGRNGRRYAFNVSDIASIFEQSNNQE